MGRLRQPFAGRPLTLGTLRLIFWVYVGTLVVLGTTLMFQTGTKNEGSPTLFAVLVCATGIYGLGVSRWSQSRPLATTSASALATTYRANFFIGVGAGMVAAMMGFVGSLVTGNTALYLLGAAFTVVALATAAPTAGRIRRRDEQLASAGSPLLLSDALQEAPARPA